MQCKLESWNLVLSSPLESNLQPLPPMVSLLSVLILIQQDTFTPDLFISALTFRRESKREQAVMVSISMTSPPKPATDLGNLLPFPVAHTSQHDLNLISIDSITCFFQAGFPQFLDKFRTCPCLLPERASVIVPRGSRGCRSALDLHDGYQVVADHHESQPLPWTASTSCVRLRQNYANNVAL
jgi:hypothetical protein